MKKWFFLLPVALAFFITGCDTQNIETEELIGKTKEEILSITFSMSPRTYNQELNIGTQAGNARGAYENYYYKTKEDALKDKRLMKSDIWEIDKRKRFSLSVYQKMNAFLLFFKNGKVVKVEITHWNKK